MKCATFLTVGLAILLVHNAARAQGPMVRVTQYYPGGNVQDDHSPVDPFELHIARDDVHTILVHIIPANTTRDTTDIGRIVVKNGDGVASTPSDIRLYIATDDLLPEQDVAFYVIETGNASKYACRHWAGIEDNRPSGSGDLHLKAFILGNLTGSIERRVDNGSTVSGYTSLNTLEVGGTVVNKVWANHGFFRVRCGDAGPATTSALKSDTRIRLVSATAGDLACNILAGDGYPIDLIEAPNGVIGPSRALINGRFGTA